ncbi:hypothetical protein USB125703_01447 [Pseudoclavibacter triregionum]|nr:hypothetical protein USB125703_01447 [Pseudoclavibacter triregionum]
MSDPSSQRAARRFPPIPQGETVASFGEYAQAKAAVGRLADAGFPIEHVSIIGSDLKSVERVTGRMSYARAAASGLMSGLMLAMFAGLVSMIVNPEIQLGSLLAMGLVAVGFGLLWGVVGYAMNPAKRDFTSVMQTVATRFDVVVPASDAAAARQRLGGGAPAPQQAPAAAAAGPAPAPFQDAASSHGAHAAGGRAPASHESAQAPQGRFLDRPTLREEPVEAHPGSQQPVSQAPVAPQAPAALAATARTYGEVQDELRRQEAARRRAELEALSRPRPAADDDAAERPAEGERER